MTKKPLALIILDGYGAGKNTPSNAITQARTPFLDSLFNLYPHCLLECSGLAVGLPDGQMGNSEVGHTNMGAGRVVYQELTRITKAITEGDFFTNEKLLASIKNAKDNGSQLHLMGLVSDGGVHSHITHLFALLKLCKAQGVSPLVHVFTDGRDVPPSSAASYVTQLLNEMHQLDCGKIATVCGRYYALDRDSRWKRLDKAYRAIALGNAPIVEDFLGAIQASYNNGITDEFIKPMAAPGYSGIKSADSVIFFNYRPDRAREITAAFTCKDFELEREGGLINPHFTSFTQYDKVFTNVHVAFEPQILTNMFGEYISKNGLSQLRIAETEKYAHVTFFFDGGDDICYPLEERILVPSPSVDTYDLKPEMSAYQIADALCRTVSECPSDVIILNFANCDMVGHTGVFPAAVAAVEAVDTCCSRVFQAINQAGGICIFTADHGNADYMYQPDGIPFTAHTTSPVPFILCSPGIRLAKSGSLCDIAPTMLELLGLPKPPQMSGTSLIV